jgi:hypothetical protein
VIVSVVVSVSVKLVTVVIQFYRVGRRVTLGELFRIKMAVSRCREHSFRLLQRKTC